MRIAQANTQTNCTKQLQNKLHKKGKHCRKKEKYCTTNRHYFKIAETFPQNSIYCTELYTSSTYCANIYTKKAKLAPKCTY